MTLNETLIAQLEMQRLRTLETFQEFSRDQWLFQPQPELNHPLWLLGHTATSEDHLILDWCGGQGVLSDDYRKLFAINSKPQTDLAAYPAIEAIQAEMSTVHKAAIRFVRDLAPADFDQPPRNFARLPERAKTMFPTTALCIIGHIAHEANHHGQLAYLRRLLGKPYRV